MENAPKCLGLDTPYFKIRRKDFFSHAPSHLAFRWIQNFPRDSLGNRLAGRLARRMEGQSQKDELLP